MLNCKKSVDFNYLSHHNVILELEDIKSPEEKALIMGFVLSRMSAVIKNEHKKDSNYRHITLVEEAHRLLSKVDYGDSGSKKVAVETFTDLLAEVRKYGEGLIIIDQIPNKLSPEVLKNTNTKIIMRLPDADDRRIAGKSASMKDNQIDEIAKLPTGVAVIYQNDWVAPVLGKIELFKGKRIEYTQKTEAKQFDNSKAIIGESLKLLLKGRCSNVANSIDFDFIHNNLNSLNF